MPYTAQINKAERGFDIEAGKPYTDVYFEIKNGDGETVREGRQAFGAEMTPEDIRAEVDKVAAIEEGDAANREINKAFNEETQKVEETIAALNGDN